MQLDKRQIEIMEERLQAKIADGVRAAQQSEENYKALRQETQKQLHAFENEVRLKYTHPKTLEP
jgi:F0F1-type ATP synthase membrane subunit b/b'